MIKECNMNLLSDFILIFWFCINITLLFGVKNESVINGSLMATSKAVKFAAAAAKINEVEKKESSK